MSSVEKGYWLSDTMHGLIGPRYVRRLETAVWGKQIWNMKTSAVTYKSAANNQELQEWCLSFIWGDIWHLPRCPRLRVPHKPTRRPLPDGRAARPAGPARKPIHRPVSTRSKASWNVIFNQSNGNQLVTRVQVKMQEYLESFNAKQSATTVLEKLFSLILLIPSNLTQPSMARWAQQGGYKTRWSRSILATEVSLAAQSTRDASD